MSRDEIFVWLVVYSTRESIRFRPSHRSDIQLSQSRALLIKLYNVLCFSILLKYQYSYEKNKQLE